MRGPSFIPRHVILNPLPQMRDVAFGSSRYALVIGIAASMPLSAQTSASGSAGTAPWDARCCEHERQDGDSAGPRQSVGGCDGCRTGVAPHEVAISHNGRWAVVVRTTVRVANQATRSR